MKKQLLTVGVCIYASCIINPATAAESSTEPAAPFLEASSPSISTEFINFENWLSVFEPPDTGRPDDTENGSSRDDLRCLDEEPLMRPFLPTEPYGLTTKSHPDILIDIPSTSAQQALLSLRNEVSGNLHQALLPIPEVAGLAGFRLPVDMPSLEPNQTYRWSLAFICGRYYTPSDPTVGGWVRRVLPTEEFLENIATRSPDAQAHWLSENGYWYDLSDYIQTTNIAE